MKTEQKPSKAMQIISALVIIAIAAVFMIRSTMQNELPKEIVTNFTFNTVEQLDKKYGESVVNSIDYSRVWQLENDIKITAFYNDNTYSKIDVLRIFNLDIKAAEIKTFRDVKNVTFHKVQKAHI